MVKLAVPVVLLLALLAVVGRVRLRSAKPGGGVSAASAQLGPLAVGEPVLDQLLAGARSANLVVCVIDAARADHVGGYGYPRETTPNMDELAKESVIFRNHFSPYPSTKPSTASLLTGLYPDTHCIVGRKTMDAAIRTLEELLKGAGFHTAFFSSNAVAAPAVGIGGDFERVFVNPSALGSAKKERIGLPEGDIWRTPEGLTQVFGKWLSGERRSRFFAYLHFLPPHNPYDAPDELKALFADSPPRGVRYGHFEFPETRPSYGRMKALPPQQWQNLYDANLRWADWGVGEMVRLLRARDLLDNTLLIVTSDHGEAFGEHGYIYHSHAVYDEFVHIPLLIRFPGRQRLVGDVAALTQTVDLLPTVLDLYQIPHPRGRIQGSSLLSLLNGKMSRLRDYVFATCAEPWPSYLVRDQSWCLILYRGGKLRALYDLRSDPAQAHNVAAEHPDTAARMIAAFRAFAHTQARPLAQFISPTAAAAPVSEVPQSKLPPQTRRELEALGYLE
jgi:arylsulfatase